MWWWLCQFTPTEFSPLQMPVTLESIKESLLTVGASVIIAVWSLVIAFMVVRKVLRRGMRGVAPAREETQYDAGMRAKREQGDRDNGYRAMKRWGKFERESRRGPASREAMRSWDDGAHNQRARQKRRSRGFF